MGRRFMRLRVRGDEAGAVLIMALFFAATFGVLAAVTGEFTVTSFSSSKAVQQQGQSVYAADGAVEGAIAGINSAFQANPAGAVPCGTSASPSVAFSFTAPTGVGGQARCVVRGETVYGAKSTAEAPPWAIEAFGSLKLSGGGAIKLGSGYTGSIYAGGTVSVPKNSSLTTTGSVQTYKSCSGGGTINGQKTPGGCTVVGTAPQDPAIANPSGWAVPNDGSTPTTVTCGTVVTFSPGTYNDANVLNALTGGGKGAKGLPTCPGKTSPTGWRTFNFVPGTYVFSFQNAGSHNWTINDPNISVVAGSLTGPPTQRPSIPGGCDTSATASGAVFVFTGNSRLTVNNGRFELCANPQSGAQWLGIAGSGQTGTIFQTSSRASVVVDGTIYAPSGDVSLDASHASSTLVTRGIVARNVNVKLPKTAMTAVSVPPVAPNAEVRLVVDLFGDSQLPGDPWRQGVTTSEISFHHLPGANPLNSVRVQAWDGPR